MIHASSPRAEGPFVPVNCGAIPATLPLPRCQSPLSGILDPTRWQTTAPLEADVIQALKPIADWLKKLSAYEFSGERPPFAQLAHAGEFTGELESVAFYSIGGQFVPIDMPTSLWEQSRLPLEIVKLPWEADREMVDPRNYQELKVQQYNTLFRELKAELMKEHSECFRAARRGIWSRGDHQREVTQQEGGLCPSAAGFVRWGQRQSSGLEDDLKFYRGMAQPVVKSDEEAFRQKLLAQFYSSVATAYVYELLHRAGHRLETAHDSPMQDVLFSYSMSREDQSAALIIMTGSEKCREQWIVRGAPSIFRLLTQLHEEGRRIKKSEWDD